MSDRDFFGDSLERVVEKASKSEDPKLASVFHRWGQGKLHSGTGKKGKTRGVVPYHHKRNPQAIAIALSEAGRSVKKDATSADMHVDGAIGGPMPMSSIPGFAHFLDLRRKQAKVAKGWQQQPRGQGGKWTHGGKDDVAVFHAGSEAPAKLHNVAIKPWKSAPTSNEGWAKIADVKGADPHPLKVGMTAGKNGATVPKRAGSGVIIHEPDGRVWLTRPTNGFGGYVHTWPKGSAEDGLTLQQNAVKEAYEETGLHVHITGHAGDYERDTSTARMYHAVRVGGDPRTAGWESEAVVLAPGNRLHDLLNRRVDQQIAHMHAGAPKPPEPKKGGGLPIHFDLHDQAGMYPGEANDHAAGWFLPQIKKAHGSRQGGTHTGQMRDGHGRFVSEGKGSFAHGVDTSKWKEDHPQAISAKKWLDHLHETINSGATHAAKKAFVSTLALPKGGNSYQNAKLKAHAAAVAHLASLEGKPVEKPAAPAKNSAADGMLDAAKWKKVGDKLGSNPGGTYEDEHGQKWYVKQSKSDDHAKNEVLADKLYQAMGVKTLGAELVKTDKGSVGVATKWNPDIHTVAKLGGPAAFKGTSEEKAMQANFAPHVLLANYDAAGTGHDNQGFEKGKSEPITLDSGGSLLYRAQGAAKGEMWNGKANEWETMRNAHVNSYAADLFGHMTASQLKDSAKKVGNLDAKTIGALVGEHGPGNTADKVSLIKTLIERKLAIMQKANALPGEKVAPVEEEPASRAKQEKSAQDHFNAGSSALKAKGIGTSDMLKALGAEAKEAGEAIENGDASKVAEFAKHPDEGVSAYFTAAHRSMTGSAPSAEAEQPMGGIGHHKLAPGEAIKIMGAAAKHQPIYNGVKSALGNPSKGPWDEVSDLIEQGNHTKLLSAAAKAQDAGDLPSAKYLASAGQAVLEHNQKIEHGKSSAAQTTYAAPGEDATDHMKIEDGEHLADPPKPLVASPVALPAKLGPEKFQSTTNAFKAKLYAAHEAVHQIGQDYAAGKVSAKDAVANIGALQSGAMTGKNTYYGKAIKHANDTIAAIQSHAGAGAVADAIKHASPAQEEKAALKVEAPKKKPFDPSKLSAPPSFLNWGGTGKGGPSSSEHFNKANHEAVLAIHEAAKSGDMEAVKKLTAPIPNKSTGESEGEKPVLEHPSQHVKGYAQQMLAEMDQQLHPKPVWRPSSGDPVSEIHSAFPVNTNIAKLSQADKGGFTKFVDLGHIPGVVSAEALGIKPDMKKSYGNAALNSQTYATAAKTAWSKMGPTAQAAIKSYTGSGYAEQNKGLWQGNPSGAAKAAASAIATHGHEIAPGTVLSRKVNLTGPDLDNLLKAEGHVLQEPAIMSTSINPKVWGGTTHLKMTVGPGVKGLYVANESHHGSEQEMLLPPNTRMLVTKIDNKAKADADGFGGPGNIERVVHVVVLPNG